MEVFIETGLTKYNCDILFPDKFELRSIYERMIKKSRRLKLSN